MGPELTPNSTVRDRRYKESKTKDTVQRIPANDGFGRGVSLNRVEAIEVNRPYLRAEEIQLIAGYNAQFLDQRVEMEEPAATPRNSAHRACPAARASRRFPFAAVRQRVLRSGSVRRWRNRNL